MELCGYVAVLVTLWTVFSVSVEGAINCYCNQPECQATHTCFSHLEKCYSKFYTVYPQQNNDTKTESKDEHGCVDLVNPGSRDSTMCEGRGDVVKALTAHESLIMCCSDNMCNYRKNLDRPIVQVDIMDTLEVKTDENKDERTTVSEASAEGLRSDEDVMFQAAVIAVPIAGGLILVILILMAVRMLREDYNRRSDSQTGLMKAHTFLENHFVKRDDKKNYTPKSRNKKSTSSIKNRNDYTPAAVHSTSQTPTQTQWSETNECLIARENNSHQNLSNNNSKSQVCVSLLSSPSKQHKNTSDIAIV